MQFTVMTTLQRHVQAEPKHAYAALVAAATVSFRLKNADQAAMTCAFSSGISAFTWGEVFRAEVLPADGGAIIIVSGVGKIPWQVRQRSRNTYLINSLFDEIMIQLRRSMSM